MLTFPLAGTADIFDLILVRDLVEELRTEAELVSSVEVESASGEEVERTLFRSM